MTSKTSIDPATSTEVTTFVRNKASQWDSAAFEKAASEVQAARAQRQAEQKTRDQTTRWKTFIQAFKKDDKEGILKSSRYDLSHHYTKEDVQREAQYAIEFYGEKGTKAQDWIRGSGRAFSETASSFEVLLEFVPDGEYTFLICGVLTLLIKASKRTKETRDKVFSCLRSLGTDINRTEGWLELYGPTYSNLWSAAEDLYVVFLESAEIIMGYINESGFRHFAGALLRRNKQVDDVKANMDEKVYALDKELSHCLAIQVNETHHNVIKSSQAVDRVEIGVSDSGQKIAELNRRMEEQGQTIRLQYQALQTIQTLLTYQTAQAQWFQSNFGSQRSVSPNQQEFRSSGAILSLDRIITLLDVPGDCTTVDLKYVLAMGKMLNSQRQARITTVLQNDRYRSWFNDASSQLLAINGMERASNGFPALTYLPALLCNTLVTMQAATPLTFFCSRHTESVDELKGGSGMMRGLCAQVLQICAVTGGIRFNDRHMDELIGAGDIYALCELFEVLIGSVAQPTRRVVIICMIDDIQWLEEEYSKELDICLRSLQALVSKLATHDGGVILKVLVTNPVFSDMSSWCSDKDIITLADSVGDRGWGVGSSDIKLESRDDYYNTNVEFDNDY